MRARVGERLTIKGHRVGEPEQDAEILEVHGPDGRPPYLVRWADDGRVSLIFPGPDAVVEHVESHLKAAHAGRRRAAVRSTRR